MLHRITTGKHSKIDLASQKSENRFNEGEFYFIKIDLIIDLIQCSQSMFKLFDRQNYHKTNTLTLMLIYVKLHRNQMFNQPDYFDMSSG